MLNIVNLKDRAGLINPIAWIINYDDTQFACTNACTSWV